MDLYIDLCVGCGYCCKKAACVLGTFHHGAPHAPCRSLVFRDGRYWCGLVLEADEVRAEFIKKEMYMGAGCSSTLFNTDREEMLRARSLR